jgi:hypothetical protein
VPTAAAGAIGLAAVGMVVSIGATRSAMPAPSGIATAPPPSHVVSPALAAAPVPDPEPTSTDATPTPTPTPTPVDEGAPAARSAGAVRTSAMPSPSPQVIASPPVETAAEPEATPTPTPTPTPTLAQELALLEEARRLLPREPARALGPLAEHRRLHVTGALSDERDLMELDALRRAGRSQEAAERARAWLARDPAGLHSSRVRAILASLEGR